MLFEMFKLRGGGTGMSAMTAVDKYGEVMGVVAWKTNWIEITYRPVSQELPRLQPYRRWD